MAILLYFGTPGAGKSYEVVSSRIIPALKDGRRVVTNVRGLDINKIKEYIQKTDKKYDINKIGHLESIDNDLILQDDFFPYFDEEEKPVEDTFIKRNDYIIIDEAWRYFSDSKKMTPAQESFFAEHRHFSIDIILINQTSNGINKYALGRVESMYECSNLKRTGLKRYVVHTYSGNKAYQKNKTTSAPKKFKKDVFALYQSYANGNGNEKLQSNSLYSTVKFKFLFIAVCFCLFLIGHGLYTKYTQGAINQTTSTSVPTKQAYVTENTLPTQVTEKDDLPISPEFKISGVIKSGSGIRYVITNGLVYIPLPSSSCRGLESIVCDYSGFSVTRFSGVNEVKK
ncbi:hypothetical protein CQM64_24765 [Salmonella enterica subsp. enterica serovar Typhimurium]|uniref:zonular occludens toxin domain-containing protein n=1 Tax=Escherichia coli TaxID=562 RepID=UPI001DC6A575|nr:hypothetical protein [Salmonella enterica subsp. enterica serovar Typhimurium]